MPLLKNKSNLLLEIVGICTIFWLVVIMNPVATNNFSLDYNCHFSVISIQDDIVVSSRIRK